MGKKKTSKKTTNKKIVKKIAVDIKAKKKTTSNKKIKKQVPKKKATKPKEPNADKIDTAEIPVDTDVSGWKKGIKQGKEVHEAETLKPKILATKEQTWDVLKEQQINQPKETQGMFILVFAKEKSGKTRFGLTPEAFEGYNGKNRDIPKGYPVFALDSEKAVYHEAITTFEEQTKTGKIIVKNYSVKEKGSKKRDSKATIAELEKWCMALQDQEYGTIVIDTFTEYCDCMNDLLVKVVGKGYDSNDVPIKKLAPVQYNWRTKQIVEFLHALREFKLNIILICQAKDEYANPNPKNPFESVKTGGILADALAKVYYWVDVICEMHKFEDEDEGFIERTLRVVDSRFEDENTNRDDYVLMNDEITFTNLVNLFKDKLGEEETEETSD